MVSADGWSEIWAQSAQNLDQGWSWSGFERSVLFVNDGNARFVDVAPVLGADQVSDGRGMAAGDLDGDGDLDLVGTCSRTHPLVYVLRNDVVTERHFVLVDLVPRDDRSPVGTDLRLTAGGRTQRRTVALGSGFLSQHAVTQHFGLDDAATIDELVIRWPDGALETRRVPRVDCRIVVRQGDEAIEVIELRSRRETATRRLAPVAWDSEWRNLRVVTHGAPDLSELVLTDLAGQPHELAVGPEGRRRGGPALLLTLFSSSCAICRVEMPELVAAHRASRAGLRVIGVSVDDADLRSEVERVVRDWDLAFPVVHAGDEVRDDLLGRLEPLLEPGASFATPMSVLLDPAGRVTAVANGPIELDSLALFLDTFRE